jgi:biopolymer transport protein ExbD
MIRRSRKQRLMAEINITPFTDVILVLLVIFMITTPLLSSQAKQIKVNLPRAKHVTAAEAKSNVMSITLSSEGPLYLEGQVVTLKELETELGNVVKNNPGQAVVLEVDRLVAFKNVVRVLDVLNSLNIERLRIAAQEDK